MAGALCTIVSLLPPPSSTYDTTIRRFRLRPLYASSVYATSPSNRLKRKNHLRLKIRKTLIKPVPTAPLPEIVPKEPTVTTLTISLPNDVLSGSSFDGLAIEGEADESEELCVLETANRAGEDSGIVGKTSVKSVLKFGGFLVGAFMFQTICAVWVLGTTSSYKEERNLDTKGNIFINGNKGNIFINGTGKLEPDFTKGAYFNVSNGDNIFINGGKLESDSIKAAYFDESELQERINEIRAMASEVREMEKQVANEGNRDRGIEKEIGARLDKLEKKLNSKREKLPESLINLLGLFGKGEDTEDDDLGSKEEKMMMFEKKLKFKSPSMNQQSNPKGFAGLKNHNGSRRDPNGDSRQSDIGRKDRSLQLNSLPNVEERKGNLQNETESGAVQETKEGMSSTEVISLTEAAKSQKSTELKAGNAQSLTKVNTETTIKYDKPASLSNDGSIDQKRPLTNKVRSGLSDVQTDFWWSNLSYVLGVLMSSKHEGQAGLYSLRMTSQTDDSYTLAFEDRGDANNFCHLLESYFEELGDFGTGIIPLSTKELLEAVKLYSEKVLVVKKGQLKLYVGQPFTEVETALHSMLHNQRT